MIAHGRALAKRMVFWAEADIGVGGGDIEIGCRVYLILMNRFAEPVATR